MNYVRCVNNKAYVRVPDEVVNGPLADLTLGAVYKALPTPQPERDAGLLRIIDNSGEDYLYPANYFQPLDWAADWGAWTHRTHHSLGPAHQSHSTRRGPRSAYVYGRLSAAMDRGTP